MGTGSRYAGALLAAGWLTFVACGDGGSDNGMPAGADGGTPDGGASAESGSGGPGNDGSTPAADVVWAKYFLGSEQPKMAVTAAGEVVVALRFMGTQVDFEKVKLDAAGFTDGAVVKIGTDGHVAWAVKLTATDDTEHLEAISVDASGDVYVAGAYRGQTFDVSGVVVQGRAGAMDDDGFIARLDGNTGAAKWARPYKLDTGPDNRHAGCDGLDAHAPGTVAFNCAATDGTLNYPGGTTTITGLQAFVGAFDPATGDVTWSAAISSLYGSGGASSNANGDLFLQVARAGVAKVSKDTKSVAWSKTYSGLVFSSEVLIGPNDDLYLGGRTDTDKSDAALLALDGSGNERWRRTWGGTSWNMVDGTGFDLMGNVLAGGDTDSRSGTSSIDGRTLVSQAQGMFVAALDAKTGATLSAWGRASTDSAAATGVTATTAGTVIAGDWDGQITLGVPSPVASGVGVFVALVK